MTDNEIIKALKCYLITNKCTKLGADILDLINRQKAEIERLKSEKEAIDDFINPLPFKTSFDFAKKVKSESIREFAERLKDHCNEIVNQEWNKKTSPVSWSDAYEDFIDDIDNLVKEMTEEPNDQQKT